MSETGMEVRTFVASDGYPLHVTLWRVAQQSPVVMLSSCMVFRVTEVGINGWGDRWLPPDMWPHFPTGAGRRPTSANEATPHPRGG